MKMNKYYSNKNVVLNGVFLKMKILNKKLVYYSPILFTQNIKKIDIYCYIFLVFDIYFAIKSL